MRTAFVVVNYNGEKYLKKCLESILSQKYKKFKVLVIDNNSRDNSKKILREIANTSNKVEVLFNKENIGFAKAVNEGISVTNSPFIALINNDALIKDDWLENMVFAAKNDLRAGIFASKIYFTSGLLNSTGHIIYRGFAVMDRGYFEKDVGQYDKEEYVAGACGAAAFYRRKLFDDIGLLDEDYFMYNDDVDLSLRALSMGWKIKYVPEAIAYHIHSASTGFLSDFSVYYNSRNWVWSVIKNVPYHAFVKEFPAFFLRNLLSIVYFSIKGKTRAIFKSKIDSIRHLGENLRKRREMQKRVRVGVGAIEINDWGFKDVLKIENLRN
ncbi:glycosyltransferase family 2 protein [Archaeoglobales archaeon]|nr:MAG: glycosyltransferase family 2 protein [Archaeoglobales archaeon]